MQPTDVIGSDISLYRGDALAVLAAMPAGSVDAVITDPPYAEKTHAGARTTRPGASLTTEKLINFASIDDAAFLSLCAELVRVTRRWVLMTCDWRHAAAAERSGLPVVRCGVWVAPDKAPQFTGDRPGTGWEAVLLLHRGGRKRWNGGGRHAVWVHGREREGLHPTQKPLGLVREWTRLFTDPGETILDPYMGSGTTGHAAIIEGRRFIGCEVDPGHYATALGRLRHAIGERSLFPFAVAPPPDLFAATP